MFNTEFIDKAYELFDKKYRKFRPEWIHKVDFEDPFVLGGYFSIYAQADSIEKLMPRVFLNNKTGWIYRIIDFRGFHKARKFYVGYFMNKRSAKRYVYGLLPNKKVILCAIVTHVSTKPEYQKHKSTRLSVIKAKNIMRKALKEDKNKNQLHIFDMYRIDKSVFKFTTKHHIRRYKPNWKKIYKLAATAKVYWKGN